MQSQAYLPSGESIERALSQGWSRQQVDFMVQALVEVGQVVLAHQGSHDVKCSLPLCSVVRLLCPCVHTGDQCVAEKGSTRGVSAVSPCPSYSFAVSTRRL